MQAKASYKNKSSIGYLANPPQPGHPPIARTSSARPQIAARPKRRAESEYPETPRRYAAVEHYKGQMALSAIALNAHGGHIAEITVNPARLSPDPTLLAKGGGGGALYIQTRYSRKMAPP